MLSFLYWVINLLLIFYLYFKFTNRLSNTIIIKIAAFVNIVVSLISCYIYLYFYENGDIVVFHNKSTLLTQILFNNPQQYLEILLLNDYNQKFLDQIIGKPFLEYRIVFMVKLLSIFNILTNSSIWLNSLYFSVISFGCALYFYRTLTKVYSSLKYALLISLFFWPGIIFWTSGLFKETLAFSAILIIVDVFFRLIFLKQKLKIKNILFLIPALFVLLVLKYYYFALLIPVLISTLLVLKIFYYNSLLKKTVLFFVLWTILIIPSMFIHPYMYPEKIMHEIVNYHDQIISQSNSQSLIIEYSIFKPHIISFIKNAPLALFSALFRPVLWEINNWLQLIPAMENAIIILLLTFNIFHFIKNKNKSIHFLIIPTVWFIIISGILLGLACPNVGTLIRYKIIFYPFMLMMLLIKPLDKIYNSNTSMKKLL